MTAPPVRLGGAAVLDGREVSRRLLEQCRATSAELLRRFTITPQLAVVLVGDDAASSIYVRAKERACARAGVLSRVVRLPELSEELMSEHQPYPIFTCLSEKRRHIAGEVAITFVEIDKAAAV